jgi:cation transport ATPase
MLQRTENVLMRFLLIISSDLMFAALLSTLSEVLCIFSMGSRASSAVRTRIGNMELLVTSACSLSYLYSFVVFAGASFNVCFTNSLIVFSHTVWLAADA